MPLNKIEKAEVGFILREYMAPIIHETAEAIAAEVASRTQLEGATVTVKDFKTDRAVSVVMLGHPAAEEEQAKSGVLTRAVASVGLTVKTKKQWRAEVRAAKKAAK